MIVFASDAKIGGLPPQTSNYSNKLTVNRNLWIGFVCVGMASVVSSIAHFNLFKKQAPLFALYLNLNSFESNMLIESIARLQSFSIANFLSVGLKISPSFFHITPAPSSSTSHSSITASLSAAWTLRRVLVNLCGNSVINNSSQLSQLRINKTKFQSEIFQEWNDKIEDSPRNSRKWKKNKQKNKNKKKGNNTP